MKLNVRSQDLKMLYKRQIRSRAGNIPVIGLIAYDFDGVLTDNRVILREDGFESVILNRSDGLAISIIKGMGINQVIITTEISRVVEKRAEKLGIPVLKGVGNKKQALLLYCKKIGVSLDSVVYLGNDINDLEAMKSVGFPVCPADAYGEIREISRIILNTAGGYGVVREFLGYIDQSRYE